MKAQSTPALTIGGFMRQAPPELALHLVAGAKGLARHSLDSARLHKLGLALAGFTDYLQTGRVQMIGRSEILYLARMSPAGRRQAIDSLRWPAISCIVITKGLDAPAELVAAAETAGVPLLATPLVTSRAINLIVGFLQHHLAPWVRLHGVFMSLHGLGVLLVGPSGIGKSECALDLLTRGHKLVADDAVEMRRIGSEKLLGRAPELLRDHLEIRGLGILNVRDLFGVAALSNEQPLDLVIRLERWEEAAEIDRLGLEAPTYEVMGVRVPLVLLPVSPGRNLATLVETAARLQLLKNNGLDAAQAFVARYEQSLSQT